LADPIRLNPGRHENVTDEPTAIDKLPDIVPFMGTDTALQLTASLQANDLGAVQLTVSHCPEESMKPHI
jgi:hypothetical protein